MKIFENITALGDEEAIKIGNVVPYNAAGLAYFANKKLSPKDNLKIIDVSETIAENKVSNQEETKFLYANELGILQDENGNADVYSPDITISDIALSKNFITERIYPDKINETDFLHYYYVSKFFVIAPTGYSIIDLDDYYDISFYKNINIKVLDSQNQEYVDKNSLRKKYKILLEPYITETNSTNSEIPYRIIIGLDSSDPVNLKLVYDKVVCDSKGEVLSQNLRYTETINAVPLYTQIAEEAQVISKNNKKVFSIKKLNKKYSDIFTHNLDYSSHQVFVPRKALFDNRTYEAFNWRIVARVNQPVNFDIVDNSKNAEESGEIKQRTINVGVLYDSNDTTSLENIKPYVFYRLEKSSFNLSKYVFQNPKVESGFWIQSIEGGKPNKSEARYWMVDIQSVDNLDDYDILSFAPTSRLSEKATNILTNYITIKNGTLLVDASSYPGDVPFIFSDIKIKKQDVSAAVVASYYEYIESSVLDENKNGGWNIDSTIFNKPQYGLFGIKKANYRYLDLTNTDKSFLNIGISSSSKSSVGATFTFGATGDKLAQGNIIFTSFSFLEYCNTVYNTADTPSITDLNIGPVAYDQQNYLQMPGFVEGPFKLLYNSVAYTLYSSSQLSKKVDIRPSLYNFVGPWESSWVMDQDVLFDDEKSKYFTNVSSNSSVIKYARDLIPNKDSIVKYYLEKVTQSIPSSVSSHIINPTVLANNTDFYIEITNPDVIVSSPAKISNLSEVKITNSSLENFSTSYFIYKIVDKDQKIFALTEKKSNPLHIPSGYGTYALREMKEIKVGGTRAINSSITPSAYFKSYPFSLATRYSRVSASEKSIAFSGTLRTKLNLEYTADAALRSVSIIGIVTRNYAFKNKIITHPSPSEPDVNVPGVDVNAVPCTDIVSAREILISGRQNILSNLTLTNFKNFEYTWDIDVAQSGYPIETWRVGSKHPYVRYVKIMMQVSGLYNMKAKTEDNNTYTAALSAAVKKFQTKVGTGQVGAGLVPRVKLLYPPDGVIDSETKSLMAYVLRFWRVNEPIYYNNVINLAQQYGVAQFPEAVFKQISASEINSGNPYRRISFTGNVSASPTTIEDFIFFAIPEPQKYEKVRNVTIKFEGAPWNKVKIVGYGYTDSNPIDVGTTKIASNLIYKSYKVHKANAPAIDSASNITIPINAPTSTCRYMFVRIQTNGKQLGGKYGNLAEGFGILSITADVTTPATTKRPDDIIEDQILDFNEVHQAFPSVNKPTIEELAQFWLLDKDGNPDPNLSWLSSPREDGSSLATSLDKHLIYTTLENKFYGWDNDNSKWVEDLVYIEQPSEADPELIEVVNVVKDFDEISRDIVYKDKIQTTKLKINAIGYLTESFENLSSLSPINKEYNLSYLNGKNILLDSIEYTYLGKKYTKTFSPQLAVNDSSLNNLVNELIVQDPNAIDTITNKGITVDFTKVSSASIDVDNSVQILEIKSSSDAQTVNANSVATITYGGIIPDNITSQTKQTTSVSLTTSASYYGDSKTYISEEKIVNNFQLITTNGGVIGKLDSVTANDGIVLLSDVNGKPVGIPTPGEVRDEIATITVYDPSFKFDINYGYVSVNNKLFKDEGLFYGFYDKNEQEFIGKLISYNEIITRGVNNIYLAVMAYDADGNIGDKVDYVGVQSTNTFKPVNISPKMITPVYSVKYKNSTAIKVAEMSDAASGKEAWPLRITAGSFNKIVPITKDYIYTDWKSKYVNQYLYCTYDTSEAILDSKFSRIFGENCKDINNEIPIIVSTDRIKLRHTPILHYTMTIEDEVESVVPAIVPAVSIYIRASESATWSKIPNSLIKDIDAENGIIEFEEQIISSDPSLIKVDYTIKDSTIWMYQVEGEEIPLNPFLNKDKIDNNKPLYIYLMPTKINILNTPVHIMLEGFDPQSSTTIKIPVTEYNNSYPVHFTYDPSIFDKMSHKYNPIALPIGIIYTTNNPEQKSVDIYDVRIKGGGVVSDIDSYTTLSQIDGTHAYWDMYSVSPRAYPKGGYVAIRIPDGVKSNFTNIEEIYDIVNRNITAGVSFEIQNLDGITWTTKNYE